MLARPFRRVVFCKLFRSHPKMTCLDLTAHLHWSGACGSGSPLSTRSRSFGLAKSSTLNAHARREASRVEHSVIHDRSKSCRQPLAPAIDFEIFSNRVPVANDSCRIVRCQSYFQARGSCLSYLVYASRSAKQIPVPSLTVSRRLAR